MVSSWGSRAVVFFAVVYFAVAELGSGRARAAADAGAAAADAGAAAADADRYAQRVATAVRSHHGEVKACYAVALERNPRLAGKFDAVWTIDTAGKPQSVHFPVPPADAEFTACMVRTITAWRFEKPTEPSEVTFPFVFRGTDASRSASAPPPDPAAAAAPPPAAPVTQASAADQRPAKKSAKETTRQRKRTPAVPTATPGLTEAGQRPQR
jgi:hypothetical protein